MKTLDRICTEEFSLALVIVTIKCVVWPIGQIERSSDVKKSIFFFLMYVLSR